MDECPFYSSKSSKKLVQMKGSSLSHVGIPKYFRERKLRVYSRSEDPKKLNAIMKAFRQWCKDHFGQRGQPHFSSKAPEASSSIADEEAALISAHALASTSAVMDSDSGRSYAHEDAIYSAPKGASDDYDRHNDNEDMLPLSQSSVARLPRASQGISLAPPHAVTGSGTPGRSTSFLMSQRGVRAPASASRATATRAASDVSVAAGSALSAALGSSSSHGNNGIGIAGTGSYGHGVAAGNSATSRSASSTSSMGGSQRLSVPLAGIDDDGDLDDGDAGDELPALPTLPSASSGTSNGRPPLHAVGSQSAPPAFAGSGSADSAAITATASRAAARLDSELPGASQSVAVSASQPAAAVAPPASQGRSSGSAVPAPMAGAKRQSSAPTAAGGRTDIMSYFGKAGAKPPASSSSSQTQPSEPDAKRSRKQE